MILIIDNNASDALVAQHVLSDKGNTTIISNDVFEALRIFVALEKSLEYALMEINMPDLSGFETIEHFKHINSTIPVIGYCADSATSIIKKCKKTGFDGFIQKPFTWDKLHSINKSLELPPNERSFVEMYQ